MLKGNNEIRLNEATVKAALQYYFDNVVFKADASPIIAGVKFDYDEFILDVEERKPEGGET